MSILSGTQYPEEILHVGNWWEICPSHLKVLLHYLVKCRTHLGDWSYIINPKVDGFENSLLLCCIAIWISDKQNKKTIKIDRRQQWHVFPVFFHDWLITLWPCCAGVQPISQQIADTARPDCYMVCALLYIMPWWYTGLLSGHMSGLMNGMSHDMTMSWARCVGRSSCPQQCRRSQAAVHASATRLDNTACWL